jgi:hypothetical protein
MLHMTTALPSCPPCPKCWSASAVSFTQLSRTGVFCRCERCGTVWLHDNERLSATLRDAGFENNTSSSPNPADANVKDPDHNGQRH